MGWDVTSCSLVEIYQHFRGNCCFNLTRRLSLSSSWDSYSPFLLWLLVSCSNVVIWWNLEMEGADPSDVLVNFCCVTSQKTLFLMPVYKLSGYMDWIGLAQDRDRWWRLVSAVMNLQVPWNAGNFLASCKPISFSRRTLHHGVNK